MFAVPDLDVAGEMIAQYEAMRANVLAAMLPGLRAFDEASAYKLDGAVSMEDWLMLRFVWSASHAREVMRVARRLADLPALAAAFPQGALSWDQLVVVVRVATPETDAQWAADAVALSVAELEVRTRRPVEANESDARARRRCRTWVDEAHDVFRGSFCLPIIDGEKLTAALDRLMADLPPAPNGVYDPLDMQRADALVELASLRIAADSDPDRATVVVHLNVEELARGRGAAQTRNGRVSMAEAESLLCDARLQVAIDDALGRPVGLGRTRRTVNRRLRRVLLRRDRHCVFPSCRRRRGLHAHHLRFWTNGGRTDPDNLALVCHAHHQLLHHDRWTVQRTASGTLRFFNPFGHEVLDRPPPTLHPTLRDWLFPPPRPAPGPQLA